MSANDSARETYIPFKARDVIQMCLQDQALDESEKGSFESLSQLLSSIFHFEFHRELEALKDAYAPFDPDSDTRPLHPLSQEAKDASRDRLLAGITKVLTKANYHQLTRTQLQASLSDSSLFEIRLDVNFDDFADVAFFARGERQEEHEVKKLLGLKRETRTIDLYERVAVYVRFKEGSYFENANRKNLGFTPGSTVIKLFRNVPTADLEILFPNVEVKMRGIDKALIGIPAAIGGIAVLMTKLLSVILLVVAMILFWLGIEKNEPTINAQTLIAAGAGIGAAAGYVLKQLSNFKNRKIRFLKALTDQLYFKNLDNNAGVIFHLITGAEEEELKEAVLAYYFLYIEKQGLTADALDQKIEAWFEKSWDCRLDFDVEDGLHKLARLGLATQDRDQWQVIPLEEATRKLDATWDAYYQF